MDGDVGGCVLGRSKARRGVPGEAWSSRVGRDEEGGCGVWVGRGEEGREGM